MKDEHKTLSTYVINRQEFLFLFLLFLKHNKCYHSFRKYSALWVVGRSGHKNKTSNLKLMLEHFKAINSVVSFKQSIFIFAFEWAKTPEGSGFWRDVNHAWAINFLNHLTVNLNDDTQKVNEPRLRKIFDTLSSLK